jgi:hypothetical protein
VSRSLTGPDKKSDSAILGILAGLGLGIAAGVISIFLIVVFYGSHGNKFFLIFLVALPYILPPGVVISDWPPGDTSGQDSRQDTLSRLR